MNLFTKIANWLAPFDCIGCKVEGSILCPNCATLLRPAPADITPEVLAVTIYDGIGKKLIQKVKFDRAKVGSVRIAELMLPILPKIKNAVIVPVTTAPSRQRQRGYDQSVLIAKKLAKLSGYDYQNVLIRSNTGRQLGANRAQRLKQLASAYQVKNKNLSGKKVILIDDVVTTGATIYAATAALLSAGCTSVYPIVFAKTL